MRGEDRQAAAFLDVPTISSIVSMMVVAEAAGKSGAES